MFPTCVGTLSDWKRDPKDRDQTSECRCLTVCADTSQSSGKSGEDNQMPLHQVQVHGVKATLARTANKRGRDSLPGTQEVEPSREPAGKGEMWFSESHSLHHKAKYRRMGFEPK